MKIINTFQGVFTLSIKKGLILKFIVYLIFFFQSVNRRILLCFFFVSSDCNFREKKSWVGKKFIYKNKIINKKIVYLFNNAYPTL